MHFVGKHRPGVFKMSTVIPFGELTMSRDSAEWDLASW